MTAFLVQNNCLKRNHTKKVKDDKLFHNEGGTVNVCDRVGDSDDKVLVTKFDFFS